LIAPVTVRIWCWRYQELP